MSFYRSLFGRALVVSLGLVLVACGSDESEEVANVTIGVSPNDQRTYSATTLSNGLKVVLVSDAETEKSAAALSVGVGAFSDPMNFQGMAHYLEHMLFIGSESFPEPDGYMTFAAENGGTSNAYTAPEITNYMISIENEAFPEALHRLSEFFISPILDPEYIQKEKNAVNAEWSMRRESESRAIYRLQRSLIGDHPANRFNTGNLETLADKPGRELHPATVEFFEDYYSANIMALALISPLPIDEMSVLAEQYFSKIPNKKVDRPEVETPINIAEVAGKRIHFKPQQDLRELRLSFIIENNSSEWRNKPNDYLGYVIGSEMANTPASVLKSMGLISGLSARSDESLYGNYGSFDINVELTPQGMKNREEIVSVILGYIEFLRREGIDDRYAGEYKQSLDNRFRFLEKFDDFSYVASLAASMQEYPLENIIDARYRFDGFDQAGVDTVLEQLTLDRLNIWYISQEEPVDTELEFYVAPHSVEPLPAIDLTEALARVESLNLQMPRNNTLLPENFDLKETVAVPSAIEVDDNVTFWLRGSEDFASLPRGFTRIQVNTDVALESPENAVLLRLWKSLYDLKTEALRNEASIAGMSLWVSTGNGLSMTLSGFTDKQPELLARALADLRVEPTDIEFSQALERYLRGLENSKRSFPYTQFGPSMSTLAREGRYSDTTLARAASGVTPKALTSLIDEVLANSHVRGAFFGNYDRDDVAAAYAALDSVVDADDRASYVRSGVYEPQPGTTLVYNKSLPVEDLGMMYAFAASDASELNQAHAIVLSRHLRVRAFETLRTEEQLGYAAGGGSMTLDKHPMVTFYIQTPVKGPQDMLDRFDAYRGEYEVELAELTPDSFEKFKAGVLTAYTEPPKNLSDEAGPFVGDWADENYDFDTRDKLISAIEAVTLESLQSFYLDTVMAESPSRILIQLKGKRYADEPFAAIEGATVIENVEAFHQRMPMQRR
ncbi:MAG: peptidase M16 [Halieaceae bacterium MED-G27]|nr:MAG: peptidase M16 [Halieaceae bacterium MED-G27]|tara:strand:- start:10876 stop:13746 length:2871 start_codon:yes stop_codon:yes gene_type:complete